MSLIWPSIDADKENVQAYFEGALRLLSPHGIVAVDNSFMDGAVLNSKTASDSVRAMASILTTSARSGGVWARH